MSIKLTDIISNIGIIKKEVSGLAIDTLSLTPLLPQHKVICEYLSPFLSNTHISEEIDGIEFVIFINDDTELLESFVARKYIGFEKGYVANIRLVVY